jgi:glutamyl-tRNA synthetase
MLWTNQQHMLRATPERLAQYLKPQFEALGIVADDMVKLAAVAKAQQERAKTLKEMAHNSRFFFVEVTDYEPKAAAKNLTRETAPLLQAAYEALATLAAWCAPAIHESITGVAARHDVGLGRVAQPIRVAVSGGTVSPPIDVTLEILGRDGTIAKGDRRVDDLSSRRTSANDCRDTTAKAGRCARA